MIDENIARRNLSLCFFFRWTDVQPVRECQLIRVAAVHFRVDAEQSTDVEYSGNDQSGGALFAGRLPDATGRWHRHYSQSGLQGGKNCGLYRFFASSLWVFFSLSLFLLYVVCTFRFRCAAVSISCVLHFIFKFTAPLTHSTDERVVVFFVVYIMRV